ncbi:Type I phosphodiesterase / nucleotide pyrophosphatase [uncultured archaeon]|nr:Type I phosphodiesterase / nucleotide pyrophosphatase [uncultured archaeon]
MSKVMMIGIDGLDPILLSKFKNELPNFNAFMKQSPTFKSESVIPPDSFSAWTSIFTGLNPAEHGILYTPDVFEKNKDRAKMNISNEILKGKTFWDIAGSAGKKVCVLFPVFAYPPWEVNGIMVSRHPLNQGEVLTFPPNLHEKYKVSHLRGMTEEHPGSNRLERIFDHAKTVTLDEANFGMEILRNHKDEDLFFIYFVALDELEHFFWRYYDENDPTYPGDNPYKNVIRDYYKIIDKIIGEYTEINPDVTTIILSDHGHGMRPPKTVNINEFLRKRGFLKSNYSRLNHRSFVLERFKRLILDIIHKYELDYWAVRISRLAPKMSKEIYMSTSTINMSETSAFLSSFAGPKSYPHGGIEINQRNLRNLKYEEMRNLLIKEISNLKDPDTEEELVKWVCKREELYSGKYISKYPDIVFELKDGFGVFWSIHTPLIGTAYEHNLAPGGHKQAAVFLINKMNKRIGHDYISLMDIAPTILDLLEINLKDSVFKGRSIFEKS